MEGNGSRMSLHLFNFCASHEIDVEIVKKYSCSFICTIPTVLTLRTAKKNYKKNKEKIPGGNARQEEKQGILREQKKIDNLITKTSGLSKAKGKAENEIESSTSEEKWMPSESSDENYNEFSEEEYDATAKACTSTICKILQGDYVLMSFQTENNDIKIIPM